MKRILYGGQAGAARSNHRRRRLPCKRKRHPSSHRRNTQQPLPGKGVGLAGALIKTIADLVSSKRGPGVLERLYVRSAIPQKENTTPTKKGDEGSCIELIADPSPCYDVPSRTSPRIVLRDQLISVCARNKPNYSKDSPTDQLSWAARSEIHDKISTAGHSAHRPPSLLEEPPFQY